MTLKDLRAYLGWSQKRFGEVLYVTPTAIQKYERGQCNPRPDVALRIKDMFGLDYEQMFKLIYEGQSIDFNDMQMAKVNRLARGCAVRVA